MNYIKKNVLDIMQKHIDEAGLVETDVESNNHYLKAIAEGIKYLIEKP